MNTNKPYRILLVNDQEAVHRQFRRILGAPSSHVSAEAVPCRRQGTSVEWEGIDLDSAHQGQAGLALVQRSIDEGRRYAVAFVDMEMPPGWNGIQCVQQIWEIDPEILVVLTSASRSESWEEMVAQLGRSDRFLVLHEPFDTVEVRQCAMALAERWSVSRSDTLTGLLNRRAFQGHVELEWERAARHHLPLSCVMLDLDFFKRVNDTLGHQAGDLALKVIARRLQSICRANDYVCRFGGEEMCILLPHTTEEGAAIWAENARRTIETEVIQFGSREIEVTASFGVAERIDTPDDSARMLDRADQSLLVAKKLGRNRVVRYSNMSECQCPGPVPTNQNGVFQAIVARHLMTAPTACFLADSSVGEAVSFFLQFRINSAPVVDEEGKLIGILSEKDVIGVLNETDAWTMPVEKIMQRNVVCYEEDAPAQSICDFLSRVAVRRVVVVRNGRPTGVISRGSLLRWYTNWLNVSSTQRAGSDSPQVGEVAHRRLLKGTRSVAQCADELADKVASSLDDPAVPLIDRVSKLQELINDLLTSWHYANLPAVIDDSQFLQSIGLGSLLNQPTV